MHEVPQGKITRIEKCILRGTRPRTIGYNARIPTHGAKVTDPVVKISSENGAWGLGWSRIKETAAQELLGREIGELFQLPEGSLAVGQAIDLPLWDLVARMMQLPLYRLLGARGKRQVEVARSRGDVLGQRWEVPRVPRVGKRREQRDGALLQVLEVGPGDVAHQDGWLAPAWKMTFSHLSATPRRSWECSTRSMSAQMRS